MALGIAEYNKDASKYRLQVNQQTLDLIEDTVSPQGQPVKKVTKFNRREAVAPQPQVVGYALQDKDGRVLCEVTVHEVEVMRDRTVLPRKVTLNWPDQRARLTMSLSRFQTNGIPEGAGKTLPMFQRSDLGDLISFDLARWAVDGPGPQRASFQTQSRQTFR